MKKLMLLLAVMAAMIFIVAVPALAAPVCEPWTWAWFKDWGSGDWYWQYMQWCNYNGEWFREWGGWGWE